MEPPRMRMVLTMIAMEMGEEGEREREREDVGGGSVGLEERRKLGRGDHDLSIRKAWHKETYQ
jgi:hypothetical protein